MTFLAGLWLVVGLVCVFVGKTAIGAATAHIEETYPAVFKKLSRHGVLFKGLEGSPDRARRGIAGPLLTGWLPAELKGDPVIKRAQSHWRGAFVGMIACFVFAVLTLG